MNGQCGPASGLVTKSGRHVQHALLLAYFLVSAVLTIACFSLPGTANAGALDDWRGEASKVRALAENDIPRAYEQAQQFVQAEAEELTVRTAREKAEARRLELAQRYEAESKLHEIGDLTRRNQLQGAELRQRELQQRWLWTILAGSVALLTVTVFLLLRLRRSHSIIRDLNANLEQRVQARTSELRQQTRYLRTLIDTLPWWVWLKDTGSRYLAVNQAAADTCGFSADALVGKSDHDVRPGELADAFRADDLEVMRSRHRKTVEERQLVADGGFVWMETFKAPVVDEDGTVLGTVGFARDISERKAVEAAREAALAEAQRLARVRSEFMAQMSHELRTPLNGILGYTQILRRDKNMSEKQAAGLTVIQQSGEHLLMLINDILDLAKIEAGKLELHSTEISLRRFLSPIGAMIKVKAEQKGLNFICDLAPELPAVVHADERRLRQALLNLLANAVKFTDSGSVWLDVRLSAPGRFRFEVRDSGVGIRADALESIFQPFEQAGDVQHREGGTGLGLAITRQFVRLMGGDIQVESSLGQGSTFWFELALPVMDVEMRAGDLQHLAIGYEGPRKTILVVDDVPENRAVVGDMLDRLGFEIVEAADGREAMEQAQALKPDLILMDIVMPVMGGLDAMRGLRDMPAFGDVPIIAISASASGQDTERYLAAGVDAFLPKPIDYENLLSQIAILLELNLICESPEAATPPEEIVPPEQELEVMYRLARMGNMQDILLWTSRLIELDERYRPFATQLHALAKGYQSKAILKLVTRHLKGNGVS